MKGLTMAKLINGLLNFLCAAFIDGAAQ